MFRKLLDLMAGTPKETFERADQLRKGKLALQGRIMSSEPIEAPIGGALCAGYNYSCSHKVPSRLKGYIRRKLREVLVYAPGLTLELEGGSVVLEPHRSERWSKEQHKVLLGEDYMEFRAKEKVIRNGDPVRVVGRARQEADGTYVVHFAELYLLEGDKKGRKTKSRVRPGFRAEAKRSGKGTKGRRGKG